jgi:cilia- and flagella-associated protein 43
LQECQRTKAAAENLIFQYELKIIKMGQACINSEDDDIKEAAKIEMLAQLKKERDAFSAEIPEVKKELDRTREDYEGALKRDKEIEKQFKKDFYVHEFYFDALTKLFKRRTMAESKSDHTEENLNPYIGAKDTTELELTAPLNPKTDMPEGIPQEVWNKLVDIRERKIAAEMDVHVSGRHFKEMQTLLHGVTADAELVRVNIDRIVAELEEFEEYKFQSRCNVENLFELKQGQVRRANAD